jgi:hypothetical protein
MFPNHPRVPKSCPPGFLGRYTVVQGDSRMGMEEVRLQPMPSLVREALMWAWQVV